MFKYTLNNFIVMPRCPNCSYILVLLEYRGKYKCAKCGKLFLSKDIDNKEFREYNKNQRKNDEVEYEKQRLLRRFTLKPRKKDDPEYQKKLTEFRAAQYQANKGKYKTINAEYYKKHKDHILDKCHERYELKKDYILSHHKVYLQKNKEKIKLTIRKYLLNHQEELHQMRRIISWRQSQKGLVGRVFDDVKGQLRS